MHPKTGNPNLLLTKLFLLKIYESPKIEIKFYIWNEFLSSTFKLRVTIKLDLKIPQLDWIFIPFILPINFLQIKNKYNNHDYACGGCDDAV
jgi:hypothetical protein